MLDLNKYTKFCQLADKIDFLEGRCGQATTIPASYMAQLDRYKKQYDKLYAELSGELDLPVNLKDYVHNLIKYLDDKNPNGEKWFYQYTELDHKVSTTEHFYGFFTYHNYTYQVELINGKKSYTVCTVNRELNYAKDDLTINLLNDEMYAPFSLRLDETCDEFDEQTSRDLKKIYIQTYIQGQQTKLSKEMTLIQQRINELKLEYIDKHDKYLDATEQLKQLDKQDLVNTK